jgi:hypothetical protein
VVNDGIAGLYRDAGLKPPGITTVDILKEAGVANLTSDSVVVDIADIIADLTGFVGTVKYLAPGATRALVYSGVLTEETAARVLVRFTVPVLGRDVAITAGDIAGNIVGGIVGGVAIAGIDLGIEAIEGAIAKQKLQDAIGGIFPMRTTVRISQLKAKELLDSLTAVKTTLDAISGAGIVLTDAIIRNLAKKDVEPSIARAKKITEISVLVGLHTLDLFRKSYTDDDPSS